MDFYDEVLRELLVAMGAALFVGNLLALLRRRAPERAAVPSREEGQAGEPGEAATPVPERAPVARTVTYMLLGFVVAFWGLASLLAS